jgi:hypothetical protein
VQSAGAGLAPADTEGVNTDGIIILIVIIIASIVFINAEQKQRGE